MKLKTMKNLGDAAWFAVWVMLILLLGWTFFEVSSDEHQCEHAEAQVAMYQECRDDSDCVLDNKSFQREKSALGRVESYCGVRDD